MIVSDLEIASASPSLLSLENAIAQPSVQVAYQVNGCLCHRYHLSAEDTKNDVKRPPNIISVLFKYNFRIASCFINFDVA